LPGGDTLHSAAKFVRHPARTAAAWTLDRLGTVLDQLETHRQALRNVADAGDIPEEGGGPVTTPSDVPLEHIPEETPLTPTEQKLKYFADKGDTKAAAQLQKMRRADVLDDKGYQEAARTEYENAGRRVYKDARAEAAAPAKWEMVANAKAAAILEKAQQDIQALMEESQKKALTTSNYTETPKSAATAPEDLTTLLEKSIAAARKKKGK
jgi:hypothetical protein